MGISPNESLLITKRLLKNLESQHDALREALGAARETRARLPRQPLVKKYPGLARDWMLVAFLEQFGDTGLGGMSCDTSRFPQSLRFEGDDATLTLRKASGFRHAANIEDDGQGELFSALPRIVMLWDWPTNPDTDMLSTLSIQMYEGGNTPLDKADALSRRIRLLESPESITLHDFNPNHKDQPGFEFGN